MRPLLVFCSTLIVLLERGGAFSPSCKCSSFKASFDTFGLNERKPGVSSPEQLREFVNKAGKKLVVIDVRVPDDVLVNTPCKCNRPKAVNIMWDKESNSMEVPFDLPKDTPIITHCNSGGRGQKACDFLKSLGYTNVVNGGGPMDEDCWGIYGDL